MIIDRDMQRYSVAAAGKVEGDKARMEQLKRACQEFESTFVAYMLKTMRETVPSSDLLGEGLGGAYFQDMFDGEVAKSISTTGGMGIWEMLFRQLSENAPAEDAVAQWAAGGEGGPRPSVVSRWAGMREYQESMGQSPSVEQGQSLIGRIQKFLPIVQMAAQRHGVDPSLIQAVIAQESAGDPQAISPKGAKGLMQLMDGTAQEVGVRDSMDPMENILGGTRYLRMLLDRFDGDVSLALASYNAGADTVDRYGGIPPYPETRRYVKNVLSYHRMFGS